MLDIRSPTWSASTPEVNLELVGYPKKSTDASVLKEKYKQMEHEFTAKCITVYSDVSKGVVGVGAAAVTETMSVTASILKETSIFSAESYAIHLALNIIKQREERRCTICSDSLSVLRGLMNRSDHPMLRKILHEVDHLHSQVRRVKFCWVPSHINIPGNEKADAAAARRSEEFIPIYYKDWNAIMQQKVKERWISQWRNSGSKLLEIAAKSEDLGEVRYTNGKDEVFLNRVRVEHSFITHGYLMNNDVPDVPPICNVCNEA